MLVQFAVPKEMLGVAVGAIFFFQMIGIAVSPAILGFAQSSFPDLEGGLKLVFRVSAIALLLILTIPEISLYAETVEKSEQIKSGVSIQDSPSWKDGREPNDMTAANSYYFVSIANNNSD